MVGPGRGDRRSLERPGAGHRGGGPRSDGRRLGRSRPRLRLGARALRPGAPRRRGGGAPAAGSSWRTSGRDPPAIETGRRASHPGPLRRRRRTRPRGRRRATRPDAGAGRRGARGRRRIASSCSASRPASPTSARCRRRSACRAASSPGRACRPAAWRIAGSQTAVYPVGHARRVAPHRSHRRDRLGRAPRPSRLCSRRGDTVRFEPVRD